MPALSPTMEEGKLAKWLVKEGDVVKSGDILAEIETDKATMEFEAVDEGKIGKLLVAEGTEGVKVNAPIATLIGDDGKADVDISKAMQSIKSAVAEAAPVPKPAPAKQNPLSPSGGEGKGEGHRCLPPSPHKPKHPSPPRQHPHRTPTANTASSPRRSLAASPSRRALISPRCKAPARAAAS
jgi:pyruvate/2-oxoglutarate dehydrogenase complex dihydrolipoamide acyltransferase (E2) component